MLLGKLNGFFKLSNRIIDSLNGFFLMPAEVGCSLLHFDASRPQLSQSMANVWIVFIGPVDFLARRNVSDFSRPQLLKPFPSE